MSAPAPANSAFYLSAAHKSSGKTLMGIGLARALRRAGRAVTPFKKGPDYIDAGWLGRAAGAPCTNLDFNTQSPAELLSAFSLARDVEAARGDGSVRLIEGTKGLHDGVAADGSDSNAALAVLLDVPVVLVFDSRGMTRGAAALLDGLARFDPGVRLAGVILNRTGGTRHEAKLRAAVERYTDLAVLGCVGESPSIGIIERHLGLVTPVERDDAGAVADAIADVVDQAVDVGELLRLTACAPPAPAAPAPSEPALRPVREGAGVRIGIPRDSAFCFYYPGDLAALECAGAELVFFDALKSDALPRVDGLFIGGGFPETHMHALAANAALRGAVAEAAAGGLPIYAECGGLMYLSRSLQWRGDTLPMCGVLPVDVAMSERPRGRGYVRLRETGLAPWGYLSGPQGGEIRAHEFHYSFVSVGGDGLDYAYEVARGTGVDGEHDGIVLGNVLASYAHLRHTQSCPWATRFVSWVHLARQGARDTAAQSEPERA